MQQLTYISTTVPNLPADAVEKILRVSRRNNARDGITGVLVHDGVRFLQALEGYKPLVDAAFARIKADPRHRAAVMLSYREVTAPEFGPWDMASYTAKGGQPGASLAATVDALVAEVSHASTRELFRSFARIDRAAA